MQTFTLIRDYSGAECTLGSICVGGVTLKTLERPWIPDPPYLCGHPDTSCVPSGIYALIPHNTPKFPKHFALVNESFGVYHESVPAGKFGRTACLIHTGNRVEDVEGCLILGTERELIGEWTLLNSREAYATFQAAVPWVAGYSLIIEYAPGVSA